MAQADTTDATQLRSAILNICGFRQCPDGMQYCMPSYAGKPGKQLAEVAGNIIGDYIFEAAKSYFDKQAPFQMEDILISGSHNEGMQQMNLKTESVGSDTDFMLILKNIKVSEEDQQKGNLAVRENTAFVNLYLTDEELIRTWGDFLETSTNTLGRKKLSSMKLKKRFRENYTSSRKIFSPLSKQNVEAVDEGPSLVVSSHQPENEDVVHQYLASIVRFPSKEMDLVLAIKCDGWPLCAKEWRFRPRFWPNQDVVQAITESGFHIVCKSSSEGDFRLSYSNAETLLIRNLTSLQHKTYRAFKSFVGHYKNKWSPKNIKKIFCSYHLKTIMLWYCEKSEPKDWTEGSVDGHLLSLIDKLIIALKERILPMYFMPKYNLMEKMEDGRDVAEKITELRHNVHLITYAVIQEEPNMEDLVNFILDSPLSEYTKPIMNTKDFYQIIDKIEDCLDDFYIKCTVLEENQPLTT